MTQLSSIFGHFTQKAACLVLLIMTLLATYNQPLRAETFNLVTATFAPFTDPSHPKGGFLVELTRAALQTQGHDLRVTYYPWPRALKEAEEGHFDGLLSAYYSEERAQKFYFSAPLNRTQMVLVGLKDNYTTMPHYASLDDLKDHTIGTGRKWAYNKEFDSREDLTKIPVKDEATGIKLLFTKRIDLFAVNEQQFKATLNKIPNIDSNQVMSLSPTLSFNDQHIAATKKNDASHKFLCEINTGLAAIRANGTLDKIKATYFGKSDF